jgi:membrane-bound lytic murein transglycosylase MltF
MIKYRFAGLNPNSWMVKSKNVGGLKLNPYFGALPSGIQT